MSVVPWAVELAATPMRSLGNPLVWVPLTAWGCAFFAFYYSSTTFRLLSVALQVTVAAFMLTVSDNLALKRISVGIVALCLPIAIANAAQSEAKSLIVPLCFLGAIGCAWYALEFGKTRSVFELPFYAYLALTIYLIIVRGFGPREFDDFYAGIGRNGYSAILFALTCGYVVSRAAMGRQPSLLLLAIAFACSIPLYGRSSIVALASVFVAASTKRWALAVAILAMVAAALIASNYIELEHVGRLTNFKSGLESDRWQMIGDYLDLINPRTLLLGVPFAAVNSIQENGGSPDVAFLRLHSYLGIAVFAFVGLFVISAITLIRDRYFVLLIMLVAIVFRAFTDIILLFGTVDYFFIAVLFFPYFRRYFAHQGGAPTR